MMYALDLPTHTAVALVCIEKPDATWNRSMNAHPKSQLTDPRQIQAALDGKQAQLPTAAWIARRAENGWRTEDLKPADPLKVSRVLGYLAALQVSEDVLWTKAEGFSPRAGALGLLMPAADYTLLWVDSAVRRVVIGAPSPFGRGVFMFDNLSVDRWGNPHPRGLYLLKG